MSGQREGQKWVPRAFSTVVNTLMRATSLARHCSGVELSSGGTERSSDTPASSWRSGVGEGEATGKREKREGKMGRRKEEGSGGGRERGKEVEVLA